MTDTQIYRPVPDFTPSSPSVTSDTIAETLATHAIVIVHFWAVWNGYYPPMDTRLVAIRNRLPESVHYASCNLDDSSCFDIARSVGVLNCPWLAVFVGGQHVGDICGLLDPAPLTAELLRIITNGDVSGSSPVA